MLTTAEILKLVAKAEFRPFTKNDFMSFGGVETRNPLIGEIGELLVILDGDLVSVLNENGDEHHFRLKITEANLAG